MGGGGAGEEAFAAPAASLLAPALQSLHCRRGVKGCPLHGGERRLAEGQGGEAGDPRRRGGRGWRGGRLACGPTWYLVPTPGC